MKAKNIIAARERAIAALEAQGYPSRTRRRKSGISSGGSITRSFSNPQSGLKILTKR